jgi:hypothetical protein
MMSLRSKRRKIPVMISPLRSLYSLKISSRSASRTRWMITCLAAWAAMRPKPLRALWSSKQVAEAALLLLGLLAILGAVKHLEFQHVALLDVEVELRRAPEGNLLLGLGHHVDHGHTLEEVDAAVAVVEARHEVAGAAKVLTRRGQNRALQGLHEHRAVDALVLGDDVEGRREVRGRVRIRGGLDLLRRHVGV